MDALLYTPEEAAQLLRIGRSRTFDLIRTGELASIKIGSSRRVPREAITAFITSMSADADTV